MVSSKRLLVVEDDEDTRAAISALFRSEGFDVEVAESGKSAIAQLSASLASPCAILLDLFVPDGGGRSVLEFVRNHTRFRAVPIIVVTGAVSPKLPEGVQCLHKPLDVDELVDLVSRCAAA